MRTESGNFGRDRQRVLAAQFLIANPASLTSILWLYMPSSLANKWVLITGASSGFGAAAARAFAREGAKLLLGARRVDRLQTVTEAARKAGAAEAKYSALDVSQTSSVNAFVQWAGTLTGRLDVLINNAGGAKGL